MKTIKGDLIKLALAGRFDMIIHGCNCFHTMGAGIAKQIRKTFPIAYEVDLETEYGSRKKLGTFSYIIDIPRKLVIVNAYTQYNFRGRRNVDYVAIRKAFRAIRQAIRQAIRNFDFGQNFPIERIGYPKIGAGLAGGDWNIISKIIEDELFDLDHTLVELP